MAGFFIGMGIRSDDSYLYLDSLQHKDVIVCALADNSHASKALQILNEIVKKEKGGEVHA